MKLPRTIKFLLTTVLVILLLAIAVPAILLFTVDPNQFKPQLESQVNNATGLSLNIKGDLSWRFLPSLSMNIGSTEVHTARAYDGDTLLAKLESIETGVNLPALLTKNLQIEKLKVNGLLLRMVTNTKGKANWEDIESSHAANDSTTNTTADSIGSSTQAGDKNLNGANSAPPIVLSSLSLNDISLQMIDLSVNTRQALLIDNLSANNVNLNGKPFPIKTTLTFEQEASAEKNVAATNITLNLDANVNINPVSEAYALKNISGSISSDTTDKSRFTGYADVKLGKTLFVDANINIDAINVDEYLSNNSSGANDSTQAQTAHTTQTTQTTSDGKTGAEELPLDMLQTLNTQIKISIGKLIANNSNISNITLNTRIKKGVLDVEQFHADVYDGSVDLDLTLNSNKNPAELTVKQSLTNIEASKALASQAIDVDLSGKANVVSNLTSRGNSIAAWIQDLHGSTLIEFNQGRYGNDNIEHRICQAIAAIRQEALSSKWPTGTDFNTLRVPITWTKGIGQITQLEAGLRNASLNGSGQLSLIDTQFDFRLNANVSGDVSEKDPACQINERYRNIAWPLRCRGNADNSKCGIDNSRLDKIIANTVKTQVKEKAKEKVQEKINEKLGGDLGKKIEKELGEGVSDALKGLFK